LNNSSSSNIINCAISNNTANNGGGIYNGNSSPNIVNCTIGNNSALNGGGVYIFFSSPTISNSIIWGNSSGIVNFGANPTVSYSIVQGGYSGTGNLNQDPQFANAVNGDFTLQNGSPAINKGDNNSYENADGDPNNTSLNLDKDVAGNNRLNGTNIDMGAFESQSPVAFYFTDNTADITEVNSWWSNDDGTGAHPADFITAGQIFNIIVSDTLDAQWNISNATLNIGDENHAVNFTVGNGLNLLDLSGGAVLNLNSDNDTLMLSPKTVVTTNANTTYNFNGHPVVLQSDVSGTAAIFMNGAVINGATNVTVQRWVGGTQDWRMVGFPLTTNVAAADLSKAYAGGKFQAYSYDETADDGKYGGTGNTSPNAGWKALSAISPASFGGILLIGNPAQTVSAKGTLNTASTTDIPLSYSSQNENNGWNFIANPYPITIDWNSIFNNNPSIDGAYYRYNPNTTAYESYVAGEGGIGDGLSANGNQIENGAGFFIHLSAAAASLAIGQNDQLGTTTSPSLMGGSNIPAQPNSRIRLSVSKEGDTYSDDVLLLWGGNAGDGFDAKYDAYDLGRTKGADLSVQDEEGVNYSIFHGSRLQPANVEHRKVALKLSQLSEGIYTFKVQTETPLSNNNRLFMYDRYLDSYTAIDSSEQSVSFMVNSITATQETNRFSLVFNAQPEEAVVAGMGVRLLNNPTVDNSFTLYSEDNIGTLQWQLVSENGSVISSGQLHQLQSGGTYKQTTPFIAKGLYFIQLTADGKQLNTLKLMKQ
jgi:hypothetical protein